MLRSIHMLVSNRAEETIWRVSDMSSCTSWGVFSLGKTWKHKERKTSMSASWKRKCKPLWKCCARDIPPNSLLISNTVRICVLKISQIMLIVVHYSNRLWLVVDGNMILNGTGKTWLKRALLPLSTTQQIIITMLTNNNLQNLPPL